MKWVIALTLLGLAAAVVQAAAPVKAQTRHAKLTKGGKSQHVVASNVTAGSKSSRRGRYAKGRLAHRASSPSYQTHPDANRYQEIQKALADRGYLKSEPNGQWDSDSVDALKRFQADQRLDTDGKINARTLFGLGLGPKHDGSAVASAAVPAPDTQTTNPQ